AASCMPRIESIVASPACTTHVFAATQATTVPAARNRAAPWSGAPTTASDRQIFAGRRSRLGDALPPEAAALARATRLARKRAGGGVAHVLQRPRPHEHDASEDGASARGAPLAARATRRHFDARSRRVDALPLRRRRSAVAIDRH